MAIAKASALDQRHNSIGFVSAPSRAVTATRSRFQWGKAKSTAICYLPGDRRESVRRTRFLAIFQELKLLRRLITLRHGKASDSDGEQGESGAVQARRVAGMLSPPDAQLAEACAVEYEDQAREASFGGFRSARLAIVQSVVDPIPTSVGSGSPKQVLFCED